MSKWLRSEVRLFRSRGAQALIPTVLLVAVSGLAVTLVVAVIATSPYTHSNLSPAGYERTNIVYLGEDQPLPRAAAKVSDGDIANEGRALFVGLNCAACHGLKGQGGVFAPAIIGTDAGALATNVRRNPAGMPSIEGLTEQDFEALAAYLRGTTETYASSKEAD